MSVSRYNILDILIKSGVKYKLIEHAPIFTVSDGEKLQLPDSRVIAKSLFLTDKKKYYLILVPKDRKTDLKALKSKIGSGRLSFAKDEDLFNLLKLSAGAVSPFGVFNDEKRVTEVFTDEYFRDAAMIAVPLNDNKTTVYLKTTDLFCLIEAHGNKIDWLGE